MTIVTFVTMATLGQVFTTSSTNARRATAHFLREGQTATEAGALEWLCCSTGAGAGAAGGWWTRLALEPPSTKRAW